MRLVGNIQPGALPSRAAEDFTLPSSAPMNTLCIRLLAPFHGALGDFTSALRNLFKHTAG